MQILIDDTSIHKNIIIDDVYKLYIVENVIEYSVKDYNTHVIDISTNAVSDTPNYYFTIDLMNDSFAHWVYESAIYLPIFNKLKELYSTIKLVLKSQKQFKKLFVQFFNINESDIIYDNAISSNNICLFPSPISLLNERILPENFRTLTQKFVNIFHSCLVNIPNKYDFVVMPRQTKENSTMERTYDFNCVYNTLNEKKINYFVLNTDDVTNLLDQIQTLRSSSNVALCDASAFLVNNMFCLNSDIHIIFKSTLGGMKPTEEDAKVYPKLNCVIVEATQINNNKLHYVYTDKLEL